MTDQFIAEIRIFPFNFAPTGWALCAGQLLPISQNTALFSLLGTTYGGDGKSNFALPNLNGLVPIQQGQGPGLSLYDLGQTGGVGTVTLLQSEIPLHPHSFSATTTQATTATSGGGQLAKGLAGSKTQSNVANCYSSVPANATTALSPNAMSISGANAPHNNMMPYLSLSYCIAMQGVFPSRP